MPNVTSLATKGKSDSPHKRLRWNLKALTKKQFI